jgi:outer membrane lipopolysaccharide assembly protein LptE/RlpB
MTYLEGRDKRGFKGYMLHCLRRHRRDEDHLSGKHSLRSCRFFSRLHGEILLLVLCLVVLWGCGYHLTGKETHLPSDVNSIAIPTFVNNTFEPGIEIPFTQAFLNEFIRDKRVKVTDQEKADSILEGTIKALHTSSVSYSGGGLAEEYRVTVTVDVVLIRRGGEVLWRENSLSETWWYRTTSSSALVNEGNRFVALQNVGALMAERVRNRFFYNF